MPRCALAKSKSGTKPFGGLLPCCLCYYLQLLGLLGKLGEGVNHSVPCKRALPQQGVCDAAILNKKVGLWLGHFDWH
jgi:hypothetical protein